MYILKGLSQSHEHDGTPLFGLMNTVHTIGQDSPFISYMLLNPEWSAQPARVHHE